MGSLYKILLAWCPSTNQRAVSFLSLLCCFTFLTYVTLGFLHILPYALVVTSFYLLTVSLSKTLAQPVSFLQFFMALGWWHINTVYHRISVMQVSWEKTHTHESKTKLGIVWILSIKWYHIWHKAILYAVSLKCRLLTWPCQWERDNHSLAVF